MTTFNLELANTLVTSTDEFPVYFDDMWQWLGYTTKGNAKRHFENCGFLAGEDFCSFITNEKRDIGATRVENIRLTVECAKQWAMMSGTDQGKQVRRYFIECERKLKQVMSKTPVVSLSRTEVMQLAMDSLQKELNYTKFCNDKPGLKNIIDYASSSHKHLGAAADTLADICLLHFNVDLPLGALMSLGRYVAGEYKSWYHQEPTKELREVAGKQRLLAVYTSTMYPTIENWLKQANYL